MSALQGHPIIIDNKLSGFNKVVELDFVALLTCLTDG